MSHEKTVRTSASRYLASLLRLPHARGLLCGLVAVLVPHVLNGCLALGADHFRGGADCTCTPGIGAACACKLGTGAG